MPAACGDKTGRVPVTISTKIVTQSLDDVVRQREGPRVTEQTP